MVSFASGISACGHSTANARHSIAYYMTILTTTEDRTINSCSARNINRSAAHISPSVEEHTLVTLTGTEHVTNNRIIIDLLLGTWHTDSTARHINGTFASRLKRCCRFATAVHFVRTHISLLISAIYAGQNMSACDIHLGITTYRTCCTMPFARSKRNNTTTTAKHIAVVGMSVCSYRRTTLRRCQSGACRIFPASISILVIRLTCGLLVIRPSSTCCKVIVFCHCSSGRINESRFGIRCILAIITITDLSTCYCDMSISLNIAIFTTTIDGSLDEGMLTNRHIRVRS